MMQPQTPAPGATQSAAGPSQSGPAAEDAILGFTTLIRSLIHEVWTLARDHILLVVLEAQHASRTVTTMVFAGIVAAVLLVTAWLALVASVLFWVVAGDPAWAIALLAVGLIHIALSAAVIAWIRRVASNRMFSVLLRHLNAGGELPGDRS